MYLDLALEDLQADGDELQQLVRLRRELHHMLQILTDLATSQSNLTAALASVQSAVSAMQAESHLNAEDQAALDSLKSAIDGNASALDALAQSLAPAPAPVAAAEPAPVEAAPAEAAPVDPNAPAA